MPRCGDDKEPRRAEQTAPTRSARGLLLVAERGTHIDVAGVTAVAASGQTPADAVSSRDREQSAETASERLAAFRASSRLGHAELNVDPVLVSHLKGSCAPLFHPYAHSDLDAAPGQSTRYAPGLFLERCAGRHPPTTTVVTVRM